MISGTPGGPYPTATFFGGVVPASEHEERLAYGIGAAVGGAGLVLQHGGYNGLMEEAARGAATAGGHVVAVTLTDVDWGEFNLHVTEAIRLPVPRSAAGAGARAPHWRSAVSGFARGLAEAMR